jgi:hypothetical protein
MGLGVRRGFEGFYVVCVGHWWIEFEANTHG